MHNFEQLRRAQIDEGCNRVSNLLESEAELTFYMYHHCWHRCWGNGTVQNCPEEENKCNLAQELEQCFIGLPQDRALREDSAS